MLKVIAILLWQLQEAMGTSSSCLGLHVPQFRQTQDGEEGDDTINDATMKFFRTDFL